MDPLTAHARLTRWLADLDADCAGLDWTDPALGDVRADREALGIALAALATQIGAPPPSPPPWAQEARHAE